MRTKNIILSIAAVSGLCMVSSCADMDTAPQGGTVTSEQKTQIYQADPSKQDAVVSSVFAGMKEYMPNYDVLGEMHSDFGFPSIMLITDFNGQDLVSSNDDYNWFSYSLNYMSRVGTSDDNQIIWGDLYKQIYRANTIVGSIDKESENPQSQFNLAQGLAMRALSYWYLVQLYQYNYQVIDPETAPGVPLITDENADQVANEGIGRNTVQEVYDQIFEDIDMALDLLVSSLESGVDRTDKRYIDLATAYGIRARINLTVGNMAEASEDAQNAILFSDATPKSLLDATGPSFNDADEDDWMWGILVDEMDDVVLSGIVNWIGHICSMTYGYAAFSSGARINVNLYDEIPETDVRKTWFLDETGDSETLYELYPGLYSVVPGTPYLNIKFAPYQFEPFTTINANDIPLMRIEEMYLIWAEAEGDAEILENFVQTYRDPEYTCDLSGDELADEIWKQRRIELWGEGISWFDIMRLNKDVDRLGAGFEPQYTAKIPAGSPILLYPIPEKEIDANQKLSSADQNACVKDELKNYVISAN